MGKFTKLKPNGYTVSTGPEGIVESDTVQCVHCGLHWQVNPHNAKGRGHCFRCNGPICGKRCLECIPIELGLEIMEGTATTESVTVAVGKIWTPR